jgi:hypothetical protein
VEPALSLTKGTPWRLSRVSLGNHELKLRINDQE